ncbi:MAG: hypothetical protein NZ455_10605 [Bacteroidia bacterium]|nr:hypothetical protein [Bacteroidia bacterium]MDW8346566.1 hypothetical protein [Bacteroidia bacterium]
MDRNKHCCVGIYQEGKSYLIAVSVYHQVVSGIAFIALSLIDVEKQKSYSIGQEQIIFSQSDKIKLRKKERKETEFNRRG